MTRDTDAALARACADGNAAAWSAFVERYGPLVLRVARRTADRCGVRVGPADLDDLCAETFLALVRNEAARLRAYDPRWSLATYVGMIARTATIDALRARRAGARAGPEEAAGANPDDATAPREDPAEAAARTDAARAVETALGALAPRDRTALCLYYHGGLTYREIAETLKIPINTVCSTLARALERLRDRLTPPPC